MQVNDAQATPMRDHIARLVEMLSDGERRLIVEHPNPAIGTSVFSPDVSVAVAAALAHREAEEVQVKALEWGHSVMPPFIASARTPVGSYRVESRGPNGWWWMFSGMLGDEGCGSEDEAKAAAQADFEQRIRSALVAPPAQEPVAAWTTLHTGCEVMSRDIAGVEKIAREGSIGPTEVHYLYAAPPAVPEGMVLVPVDRHPTREEAAVAAQLLLLCNGWDLSVWTDDEWPCDSSTAGLKALTAAQEGR